MRFPFFLQFDSMDCGPTCLQMISAFYGKSIGLDKLRQDCFLCKDGVSLLNISLAAENIGFKTLSGKVTFNQLIDEVPFPCIIHWNQDHFVIIYKVKKKLFSNEHKIFIADPGFGLLTYDEQEFKKKWISTKNQDHELGIVLMLEPTNKFHELKNLRKEKNSLSFIFKYFLKYKKLFFQLFSGLLLSSMIQLIFPFLTQSIVDTGINNKNLNFIYLVLIGQLVLVISNASIIFIRRWILLHISARINIFLLSDFFIKLFKLPMHYYDTKLVGDIIQRIKDHERVENFLTSQTLNVFFSFFTIVIFGFVLFLYDYQIFIIFLIGSLLYVAWVSIFLKKRKSLDYKLYEQRSVNYTQSYQLINGMSEIKLQNCEKRKRWEWENIQAELFGLNIKTLSLEQYQEAGNILINEIKNILITIISATSVINGDLTLGMMLAIQYIIGQLNLPLEQAVNFIHNLQDTKISLERISEIHQKDDENIHRQVIIDSVNKASINIKELTFQYEGPFSEKVLNNINLVIPHGKVTAIVGASGSGKTTLIKLLLQYYKLTTGKIHVGNEDLSKINTVWWRNQCGIVMQDGFIFSESIARNIAVGNEEIDINKLYIASKTANIHDFISSLAQKYDTIIGQDGLGLSQGQRQRILIARAIYKDPTFIFLDEATNALDANNEKIIIQNLNKFFIGKTVVVVAHRLSTVKNAYQIVVLNSGRIVELGDHSSLTKKRGYYYQLVKNQLELGL